MSNNRKEYPIDWNLKCNPHYDVKSYFYTIVLMVVDENLCYEGFEKLIDSFFPEYINKCKELYIYLQEEGKVCFSNYTKDIADTKSLEIESYAKVRNIGLRALLSREKV